MTERIDAARAMRTGAERLRMIAAQETNLKLIAELIQVAEQMDEHAAELEHSFVNKPPKEANDAAT